jgi:hypothetical protein
MRVELKRDNCSKRKEFGPYNSNFVLGNSILDIQNVIRIHIDVKFYLRFAHPCLNPSN